MQLQVRITEITPAEFWRHGYRTGWDDREAGRSHLLDDPPGDTLADVIPMRSRDAGLTGDQLP